MLDCLSLSCLGKIQNHRRSLVDTFRFSLVEVCRSTRDAAPRVPIFRPICSFKNRINSLRFTSFFDRHHLLFFRCPCLYNMDHFGSLFGIREALDTTMPVATMVLKESFGFWMIAINCGASNEPFTPVATSLMVNVSATVS